MNVVCEQIVLKTVSEVGKHKNFFPLFLKIARLNVIKRFSA